MTQIKCIVQAIFLLLCLFIFQAGIVTAGTAAATTSGVALRIVFSGDMVGELFPCRH